VSAPVTPARLRPDLHERFHATLATRGLTITEAVNEAVALWLGGARAKTDAPEPVNPLRALRESAGLSQSQAAAKMGISKRAVQLSERAAIATPAMLERARKAFGGGR
jgi:DNA-binding transcriptional regulator YiaG